jgi:cbb3-type cytochrome oxidase subunit 3
MSEIFLRVIFSLGIMLFAGCVVGLVWAVISRDGNESLWGDDD